MKKSHSVLVTGSSSLIGSEVAAYFHGCGWKVHGLDNNMRAVSFGQPGDMRWNQARLLKELRGFVHHELDIRDRVSVLRLVSELRPDVIVHAAAQPSHDRAAEMPLEDFDTNAAGTINLLESARRSCPESPFVYLSTNKVYGDAPNSIPLKEFETRWDYDDPDFANGIPESFPVDHSRHSLFGASKLAADVLVQEYGRSFDMPTCSLRGDCLTGPNDSGVELQGFLCYLIKCNVDGRLYRLFGYQGKQVRDNIHSYDVARFIHSFVRQPRKGEVYNIGGGKGNSCSVLEAFGMIETISGKPMRWEYIDQNRVGDPVCYYSDLTKIRRHYPGWDITRRLEDIFAEIYLACGERSGARTSALVPLAGSTEAPLPALPRRRRAV